MKAVFLDRDGTLNVDTHYLSDPADFRFIPGVVEALRLLRNAGFGIVVVTNQSGVGRGMYKEEAYHAVTHHMEKLLRNDGIALAGSYCCFHHKDGNPPYNVDCDCRKPKPGLLLRAKQDLNIDMSQSYMIGDKWADVSAGRNAGIPLRQCILVKTGHAGSDGTPVDGAPVLDTLLGAAHFIVGR